MGSVLKSYISDDTQHIFGEKVNWRSKTGKDPDLDAAYEELDDFLNGTDSKKREPPSKPVPKEIIQAFAELGLEPDASLEECKEAYKKLLQKHHPDRHAKHQKNMEKATDKTARLNTAYKRLQGWFLGK